MRESGFYWVRQETLWDIAFWSINSEQWFLVGFDEGAKDSAFDEIDERRIVREEVK